MVFSQNPSSKVGMSRRQRQKEAFDTESRKALLVWSTSEALMKATTSRPPSEALKEEGRKEGGGQWLDVGELAVVARLPWGMGRRAKRDPSNPKAGSASSRVGGGSASLPASDIESFLSAGCLATDNL